MAQNRSRLKLGLQCIRLHRLRANGAASLAKQRSEQARRQKEGNFAVVHLDAPVAYVPFSVSQNQIVQRGQNERMDGRTDGR
jgi:hypothetical protein